MMFILTITGKEREGAYAVEDKMGGQILYLFEEEDDGYPDMNVVEVNEELMIKTCHIHGHEYAVITKNDIVIPPEQHDFI